MLTKELEETLGLAVDEAVKRRHEYVTVEHLLYALIGDKSARDVLRHWKNSPKMFNFCPN
jgi:ATP-dependent Clp protease ATP-binding subunit ClpA